MAFRHDVAGHRSIAEINVTPLVDVMLVMLIILMITAPVLAHQVTVHVGAGKPQSSPPPTVELGIGADAISWNGQALPYAALDAQLTHAARQSPQPALSITADDATRYEHVATVLASAQRAGIEQIGFAD